MSFFQIRRIVDHLRQRGYAQPLTDLTFATVGSQVYFRHPDGTWEGGDRPDQIVIHEVLYPQLLRNCIWAGLNRDADDAGRTEVRRGSLGSKPLFAGTRIPVATVQRYLTAGRSAQQIIESFPSLTVADITAAQGPADSRHQVLAVAKAIHHRAAHLAAIVEWHAADAVERHLPLVMPALDHCPDVMIELSVDRYTVHVGGNSDR